MIYWALCFLMAPLSLVTWPAFSNPCPKAHQNLRAAGTQLNQLKCPDGVDRGAWVYTEKTGWSEQERWEGSLAKRQKDFIKKWNPQAKSKGPAIQNRVKELRQEYASVLQSLNREVLSNDAVSVAFPACDRQINLSIWKPIDKEIRPAILNRSKKTQDKFDQLYSSPNYFPRQGSTVSVAGRSARPEQDVTNDLVLSVSRSHQEVLTSMKTHEDYLVQTQRRFDTMLGLWDKTCLAKPSTQSRLSVIRDNQKKWKDAHASKLKRLSEIRDQIARLNPINTVLEEKEGRKLHFNELCLDAISSLANARQDLTQCIESGADASDDDGNYRNSGSAR